MIFAIKIMLNNKSTYLPFLEPTPLPTTPSPTPTPTPQISGNKDDLVSFSVAPGQEVTGVMKVTGSVKGGYFFEANIGVSVLDINKKVIEAGHGTATTDWMTAEPVSFESTLDFTKLAKGPAYIRIANDNPSGIESKNKFIFIPIVIE